MITITFPIVPEQDGMVLGKLDVYWVKNLVDPYKKGDGLSLNSKSVPNATCMGENSHSSPTAECKQIIKNNRQ